MTHPTFPPGTTIATRLAAVRERIALACAQADRMPQSITLIAVSKTQPAEALYAAAAAGQRQFGENYLQEAIDKQHQLAELLARAPLDLTPEWHFIGPIQSNKTRLIAEHFQWVHSVEREKIARRLNDQRPAHLPPLNLCIQVNVSQEASKSGVTLAELPLLAHAIVELPRLRLRGLMALPAPSDEVEAQRQPLAQLRRALHSLQQEGLMVDTLSMGMSADLEAAIQEGSTMVRVGTAIFGARQP